MDDLEEMLAGSRFIGKPCSFCVLAESMTPEHLDAFQRGLDHEDVTSTGILRWLVAKGYKLPDVKDPSQALRRHKAHRGR